MHTAKMKHCLQLQTIAACAWVIWHQDSGGQLFGVPVFLQCHANQGAAVLQQMLPQNPCKLDDSFSAAVKTLHADGQIRLLLGLSRRKQLRTSRCQRRRRSECSAGPAQVAAVSETREAITARP